MWEIYINKRLGTFFGVWWVKEGLFWPFHDPGSLSPQDLGPSVRRSKVQFGFQVV